MHCIVNCKILFVFNYFCNSCLLYYISFFFFCTSSIRPRLPVTVIISSLAFQNFFLIVYNARLEPEIWLGHVIRPPFSNFCYFIWYFCCLFPLLFMFAVPFLCPHFLTLFCSSTSLHRSEEFYLYCLYVCFFVS